MITNNATRKANVTCEFPAHQKHMVKNNSKAIQEAWEALKNRRCLGAEMTDWLNWPEQYLHSEEYQVLKEIVQTMAYNYDAIVFVGIGGSYLTGKMILSTLKGEYYNAFESPEIHFSGYDMDTDSMSDLIKILEGREWAIVYTSKSGGTFEPAAAFNILYDALIDSCENDIKKANTHIFAITDANKGILKEMADENGWTTFVIPDGIGGRYSGLTPVGLLPAAIADIDIEELLLGAAKAMEDCNNDLNALAFQYAEWRHRHSNFDTSPHLLDLYDSERWYHGCMIEFMATNSSNLSWLTEWLKQLFGESEGKNGLGIFPASGVFPRDLHSLGQFLQDGLKGKIFETQFICEFENDFELGDNMLADGLDKFYGKTLSQAAEAAMHGAYVAHSEGGNPCGVIRFGKDAYSIGYLMQSMFVSAAISALLFKVNPFDQPGVEAHKRVMKETLQNM